MLIAVSELHRRLGGRVDAVAFELRADHAGREVDDAAAVAQPACGLAQSIEGALEIDGDLAIELRVVGVGNLGELHDAGVVDQYIDAAERFLRRVEQRAHGRRVGNVGLDRDRLAARCFDLLDQRFSRRGIAGVVHGDGKAVPRQPLGHRGADAAGCTSDDGNLVCLLAHDVLCFFWTWDRIRDLTKIGGRAASQGV